MKNDAQIGEIDNGEDFSRIMISKTNHYDKHKDLIEK